MGVNHFSWIPSLVQTMSGYDRFNIHAQLEHLQSKYQGTGHVNNTKWEWALNIQRDTLASHAGHYTRLAYFAICENESISRIRHRCLQNMVKPMTHVKNQDKL